MTTRVSTGRACRFIDLEGGCWSIGIPVIGFFETRTWPLPSRFTQIALSENWFKLLIQFAENFGAGMLEGPVLAVKLQNDSSFARSDSGFARQK